MDRNHCLSEKPPFGVILRSPVNGGTTKNLKIPRGVNLERLNLRASNESPFGPGSRSRAVALLVDRSCRKPQNDALLAFVELTPSTG
jgi:hypothetical protein